MESKRQINWDLVKQKYNTLCEELSLKQYVKLMGKGSAYFFLAEESKKVSKSKYVHKLANEIQYLISGESVHLDALQKHNLNRASNNQLIGE